MQPRLTVMFSTRNRSETLRLTLQQMSRVTRPSEWDIEFVVIDNGSSDGTAAVLRDAKDWLPLRTLSCSVPGKSNALNTGLEQGNLGGLVVFTDDDVIPDLDWFEAIVSTSGRWPNHAVFGGRIDPVLPDGMQLPTWAHSDFIQSFAFARHVIDTAEGEYPEYRTPFGPNYWVRRDAINGMRFSSGLGPRPRHRKLGQETELLRRLRAKGLAPIYSPGARVGHRIESARLSKLAIYERAFQLGRGIVHTASLPDPLERERSRRRWQLDRARHLAKAILKLQLSLPWPEENERVMHIVSALVATGIEVEALRLDFTQNTREPQAS